ncbi:MAG: hypothetical protein JWP73_1440, partial [Phenylobacterium sp.]|nr:hypothetical protein [Phenylobacterium sp.]
MRSLLRLFDRPAVPPPPPAATMSASSSAETAPSSGLLTVEATLQAEVETAATLRVFVGGAAAPVLEKPVQLGPQAQATWFSVHGHLLPNGPVTVGLELVDARGRHLAERTLTLQVRNEGELAEATRASLKRGGVPLAVDLVDSGLYDYADQSLTAWHDQPPEAVEAHLARLAETGQATPDEIAALRHFVDEGYLVLPDVVEADLLTRLNAALDDAVEKKIEGYEWGASQRMHNLHLQYPAIRELWLHPRIIRMLRLIFCAAGRPCQSLTYVFGSEQQYHQDTIHLTSFPAGRMCGVWTALEDVQPDSGELVVFPKSHR